MGSLFFCMGINRLRVNVSDSARLSRLATDTGNFGGVTSGFFGPFFRGRLI
jgi:hypothetical protein